MSEILGKVFPHVGIVGRIGCVELTDIINGNLFTVAAVTIPKVNIFDGASLPTWLV